jgi:hypothetical protein
LSLILASDVVNRQLILEHSMLRNRVHALTWRLRLTKSGSDLKSVFVCAGWGKIAFLLCKERMAIFSTGHRHHRLVG